MSPTEHIVNLVSSYSAIPVSKIYSRSRDDSVVYARHLAWWLIGESLKSTSRGIARRFNHDPSTIRHGIRRIRKERVWNDDVRRDTKYLLRKCAPHGYLARQRVLAEQNALNEYARYRSCYSKPPYAYWSAEDRRQINDL